jgi:hypothetical protein
MESDVFLLALDWTRPWSPVFVIEDESDGRGSSRPPPWPPALRPGFIFTSGQPGPA